ncbi:outer membrane lipoprotein [Oleiphilus messinensis]|uniref:Outer membrane lipoprotein n=1 Tax=Oleiphilus messinensis TaxID=141451 RepID=A0A1Y0IAI5_9GAMM|nr:TIGR02117 family protein [Oleiphilus messinensis]ARU56485.1 outer membrane lipoprotein [Oleiphilus messinensis]
MLHLIFILGIILLHGCSTLPEVVESTGHPEGTESEIYIANHGWHTGVILSAQDFFSAMPALRSRFGAYPFIEIGWGDAGFYRADEITLAITIRAIFWPTDSIVHVVGLPRSPYIHFKNSEVKRLKVTNDGLSALKQFLSNSVDRDKQGAPRMLDQGIYGDSQFYRGTGYYHVFNTCNKWTAKALASAGVDLSTQFKLTASSVMDVIEGE